MFVKGYKKTVSLTPNSHGQLLFNIIEHKRGIPIDEQILNGVSVIRHAVPLQEQGIFDQTRLFATQIVLQNV